MKSLCLALLACLPLAAVASDGKISKVNGSVRVEAGQSAGDVSTVNGSVTIEEGATAANVDTVNGSITIERNATVQKVESVNGGISLAADVKAASVETVNGTLKLAASAQVSGSVSAVNGSAQLAKGADIKGQLSNVNGKMNIDAAHVGGGLKTVNGDILVGADSRVEGGILVEKPNGQRVGRVPLGLHAKGRTHIRWDLKVGGKRLKKGRYKVTLRALDSHKNVLGLTKPVTISVK